MTMIAIFPGSLPLAAVNVPVAEGRRHVTIQKPTVEGHDAAQVVGDAKTGFLVLYPSKPTGATDQSFTVEVIALLPQGMSEEDKKKVSARMIDEEGVIIVGGAPRAEGQTLKIELKVASPLSHGRLALTFDDKATNHPACNVNLLPVEVKGINDTEDPEVIGDIASGVDITSRTANEQSTGYTPHSWIMAPIASSGNRVEMTFGASTSMNMTLSADKGFPNPQLLTKNPEIVNWSGKGTESSESVVELSIEGSDKIDLPIWVKNMKRRTVDVIVYPIALLKNDGTPDAPNFIPTQQQLDIFINRVFEEQMNVECNVTLTSTQNVAWDIADGSVAGASPHYPAPMVEQFPPDPNSMIPSPSTVSVPGDEKFDIRVGTRSPEQAAVIAATNGNLAHLHVYLIGGHSRRGMREIQAASPQQSNEFAFVAGGPLGGNADVDNRPAVCWVDAERAEGGVDATVEGVLWTIAHEIGHHFVGRGHPDELTGVAQLEGSDLSNRLMLSGTSSLRKNPRGVQLVKREWDEADSRVETILSAGPFAPN